MDATLLAWGFSEDLIPAVRVMLIAMVNFVGESWLRALDPRRQRTMPR